MIPVWWYPFEDGRSGDCCWDQEIVRWLTAGYPVVVERPQYGVVVIPGRYHDVERVNEQLSAMAWVLAVVTSDEESAFPVGDLSHPHMRLWVQAPDHPAGSRPLPLGWTPHARIVGEAPEKTLDWFFSGQVTHSRREECVATLRTMAGGELNETAGFTYGWAPDLYMRRMASAKVAPCPSGPVWVDTFRMWEALEVGAIPVLDTVTGQGQDQRDYWVRLLGDHPLPTVERWEEFPAILEGLLADWPDSANQIQAWWLTYKRGLRRRFLADVAELAG
jgi:hypothetical protein